MQSAVYLLEQFIGEENTICEPPVPNGVVSTKSTYKRRFGTIIRVGSGVHGYP